MRNALPPLNALRAFETAARLGSMSKAAEELNVTPGALSHQIRGLEEFLDVRLFERLPRSIKLTGAGEVLYPGLQAGFQQVREAVGALRRSVDPNLLVLSTPPGLTAKWLAPRLYRFSSAMPDVEVRVSSSVRMADFMTDGVDIAIRSMPANNGMSEGLKVELLAGVTLLPVCAPRLLERFGPLESPRDLAAVPLIEDVSLPDRANLPRWQDWFQAVGAPEAAHAGGLGFSSPDHALDAAVEGAGVLLAQTILAYDDMKSGRLIAPFDLPLDGKRVYSLVYPEAADARSTVRAFRDWVMEEVRAMDVGPVTPSGNLAG